MREIAHTRAVGVNAQLTLLLTLSPSPFSYKNKDSGHQLQNVKWSAKLRIK